MGSGSIPFFETNLRQIVDQLLLNTVVGYNFR